MTVVSCDFNRSTQHIGQIVQPGFHSLTLFLVSRLVVSLPHSVCSDEHSTDPCPSGSTASAIRWCSRLILSARSYN